MVLISGILVLLSGLALAALRMASAQRALQRGGMHWARAGILARSGVERGWSELRAGTDPAYGGEDYDGNGTRHASPTNVENVSQAYLPAAFNRDDCPVDWALRPSFFSRADARRDGAGRPLPDLSSADGRDLGYSGRLRGTYIDRVGRRGDVYVLQAEPAGGIHVNAGATGAGDADGDGTPDHRDADTGYHAILRRILGALAEAIDREDAINNGVPVDQADGEALVDRRPAGGWRDLDQIQADALGGSAAKREALAPYLATRAWTDLKVIRPNATAASAGLYGTWSQIKTARNPPVPGFERIGAAVVGRAPVNLAWARRRRPVMVALLANLEGVFLDESEATPLMSVLAGYTADQVGRLRPVSIPLDWTQPNDECRNLAAQFVSYTGSLDTWEQFGDFCDARTFLAGTAVEQRARRDILKANFNPNSNLNKFNPNRSVWQTVDKSDLTAYSTEFSLSPLDGYRISSLGRLAHVRGEVLATRRIDARFGGPRVLRLTTQREFVCDNLGDPAVAGDETGVRLPGYSVPGQAPLVTESQGTARTWGHRLDLRPTYATTWMDGSSGGVSLQTYPEPCVGSPLAIAPADYDGSIQRATVETPTDGTYTAAGGPSDMKMLARFGVGWDLDVADGTRACQLDGSQAAPGEFGNGLLHASKPVTLYPDGCYSERDRAPAYLDAGNANGMHGIMSFWCKDNHDRTADTGSYGGRGSVLVHWSAYEGQYDRSAMFFVARQSRLRTMPSYFLGTRFSVFYEQSFRNPGDDVGELYFATPDRAIAPRRWHLVTFYYDLQAADHNATGELLVDAGTVAVDLGRRNEYYMQSTDPPGARDFTLPDMTGPHRIYLGRRGVLQSPAFINADMTGPSCFGGGADATIDEFAIWDLGAGEVPPGVIAAARYGDGRYDPGATYSPPGIRVADEGGSYFTPALPLPSGSVVREILWTWTRPDELPTDFAEIELTNTAGGAPLWDPAGSRSTGGAAVPDTVRQRWIVRRVPPGPFRARVIFRRGTPLAPNTPLLDSPVFHDLTVLYDPPGGRLVEAWREP